MRRLLAALLLSMLALAGLVGAATGAGGQDAEPEVGAVHILEVKGRIDAIVANFVVRSLGAAQEADAQVVVIQMNSPGALIDRQKLDELVFRVSHSSVPVTVWIGPTGGRAYGGAARLTAAAAYVGMAPRTRIGRFEGVPGGLDADAAVARGLADTVVPTIGEFLADLDGKEIGAGPGAGHGPGGHRLRRRDARPRPRARSASGSCP